ncbi:MAG: oligosaccharide flippase family protein [Actinomycetota bacterium]|nr:oligosaccharide flippase family protein [Actinomycetota bacterium]
MTPPPQPETAARHRLAHCRLAAVGRRPLPELARQGGLAFFAATLAYNGGNFVFHMAMSRMLGPDRYGALGSLLGLVTVAVLPVSALQAAVTQTIATRQPPGVRPSQPPGVRPSREMPWPDPDLHPGTGASLRRPFAWTCAGAAALLGLLGLLAPVVDRFVSLRSPVPLLLLGAYVATAVATIVPQGVLIGRLRFRPVAVSLVVGSVVRLVAGIVLVDAGLGLDAAAAASTLSGIASLGIVLWPMRGELSARRTRRGGRISAAGSSTARSRTPARSAHRHGIGLQAGPAVLAVTALAGVSAFLGIDSLLARHYLSRLDAGYYVAAATAARVALFLPGAVAMTVFPRLAAAQGDRHQIRRLLLHALAVTVASSGGAALFIAVFSHLVIAVLFGSAYQAASGPVAILAAAAAAMGIASVLVYFFLSQRSLAATVCWAAVALVTGLIVVVHDGLDTIAWITLGVTGAMTFIMAATALGRRRPDRVRRRRCRDDCQAPPRTTPLAPGFGLVGPDDPIRPLPVDPGVAITGDTAR